MFTEQVLTLLQELKSYIIVDTGEAIRSVSEIRLAEGSNGDGQGYVFTLEAVQKQQDDSEQEESADIIKRHLVTYLLLKNLASRRQVLDYVRQWRSWVLCDLAKAFDCRTSEVPAKVADHLGFTVESAETSQTESTDKEKIGEN